MTMDDLWTGRPSSPGSGEDVRGEHVRGHESSAERDHHCSGDTLDALDLRQSRHGKVTKTLHNSVLASSVVVHLPIGHAWPPAIARASVHLLLVREDRT